MAEVICAISEIGLVDNELTVQFNLPKGMIPTAGQYILGITQKFDEILPTVLYYSSSMEAKNVFSGSIPPGWIPGEKVRLRGPFGNGFQIPGNVRRVAVVSFLGQLSRLLPVIHNAINNKASVSLFSSHLPAFLPTEVEVLPLDAISESWNWADYFAIEAKLEQIPNLRATLGISGRNHLPCAAQVLILSDFPCAGTADCGVCAVKSGGRYRLACKDGPVFDLNSLEF